MSKRTADNLASDAIVGLLKPQRDFVACASNYTWVNWTRQAVGKSFASALRADLRAVGIGPGLSPRTPRDQFLVSASQRQSDELGAKCKMHLKAMKTALDGASETEWEGDVPKAQQETFGEIRFRVREIHLPKFGTRIVCLPASAYSSVGFTGDISFDEFAKHKNNRVIWGELYPTILRIGGCIDITSTPQGTQDMFHELKNNPRFWHSTCTILDAIRMGARKLDGTPYDLDEIRETYDDDEFFRSQFMCEFIDAAMAFLTFELISACEDDALLPPLTDPAEIDAFAARFAPEHPAYLGLDVGRRKDLTVIWLDEEIGGVLVTVGVIVMRNTRFRRQREVLYKLLPKVRRAALDNTGIGMQLAEEAEEDFGSKVEPVTFTSQSKAMLAHKLRPRFEDRTNRIPNDMKVRNDLHSVRKRITAAGREEFAGERTAEGHADMFWAKALANYAESEAHGGMRSADDFQAGTRRPESAALAGSGL